MNFKDFDQLLSLVKGKSNRVVVPGANNGEALEAIRMADDNGLISEGILIGDPALVRAMAADKGLNLAKFRIIDCRDVPQMCAEAVKCITSGEGDFLVKGLVDTKYYMKAILNKEAGLVPEGMLLSHFALITCDNYHKPFGMSDAAISINPDAEQKAKILRNSVNIMRMLGVETPRVSMLCPVEKVNEKIPSTVDAAAVVEMNREGKIHNAVVEGPYDVFITFSKKLAEEKGIRGASVPGEADLVILPDLNSANVFYKGLSFFGAGVKAAMVIAGAKVPAILPSRADAPSTKLYSIALAAYLKDQHQPD